MLYPLKMKPFFKTCIWGGNALQTKYHKEIVSDHTGESWEIAAHPNGSSTVDQGIYAGLKLGEVVRLLGRRLTGSYVNSVYHDTFPLLVKFLDCNDKLSVQVHPDDAYAQKHENGGLGKTEMWYILDAKPGARLVYGFKQDMTRERFRQAIKQGTLDTILNYVDVKAGDCFFIKSGTVHALLEGLLVAEIQQNSDTTYRVFDYNRCDAAGMQRQLHIEPSIAVATLSSSRGSEHVCPVRIDAGDNLCERLASCRYFETERWQVSYSAQFETDEQSFVMLLFYEGSGTIRFSGGCVGFSAGDSFVVPAYLGAYQIAGKCGFLKSWVPEENR